MEMKCFIRLLKGKREKLKDNILKVNRSALVTGRGVILQVSLKLHFACWEGLVLHGHGAVTPKYRDG